MIKQIYFSGSNSSRICLYMNKSLGRETTALGRLAHRVGLTTQLLLGRLLPSRNGNCY